MAERSAPAHLGDDDEVDRPVKQQEFNFCRAKQAAQGRELSRSIAELKDSVAFLRKGLAHVVDTHKGFEERVSQQLTELGAVLQSECSKREEDVTLLGRRVDGHGAVIAEQKSCCEGLKEDVTLLGRRVDGQEAVIAEQKSCCEGLKDLAAAGDAVQRRLELKFEEEQTLRDLLFGRAANAREEAQEHFSESLAREQHLREAQQAIVQDAQEQLAEGLCRERRLRKEEQGIVQSCLEDQKRLCQATMERSECAAASAFRECDEIRARFLRDLHSDASREQLADQRIEALEEASAALDADASRRQAWTHEADRRIDVLEKANAVVDALPSRLANLHEEVLVSLSEGLDEGKTLTQRCLEEQRLLCQTAVGQSECEATAALRECGEVRAWLLEAIDTEASRRQDWSQSLDHRILALEKTRAALEVDAADRGDACEDALKQLSEGLAREQHLREEQQAVMQALRACHEEAQEQRSEGFAREQNLRDELLAVLQEVQEQRSQGLAGEQHHADELQAALQDQRQLCQVMMAQSECAAASAFQECGETRAQLLQVWSQTADQRIEGLEKANAALEADAVQSHDRDHRIEVLEEAKAALDADALARQAWTRDTEQRIEAVEETNAALAAGALERQSRASDTEHRIEALEKANTALDADASQRRAWTDDAEHRIEALEKANAALDADASQRQAWTRSTDLRIEVLERVSTQLEEAKLRQCLEEQRRLCQVAMEQSECVAASSSAEQDQLRTWVREALDTEASASRGWIQSTDQRVGALERSNAAVGADSSQREAWSQRAEHRIDQLEEALERSNAAVGADSLQREAWSQRAEHRIDELQEALETANAIVGADASRREAWSERAEHRIDELEEALERANATMGADASRREAWSQRAEHRIDEVEEALKRANAAAGADASEREAWSQRADRIDELEEALKRANAAVGVDASEREAWSQRAEHRIDELEKALERATAAVGVDASGREAWSQRAEHRIDELEEALERASAAVGVDASEREAWSQRAEHRIDELEEALERATAAVGVDASEREAWSQRAEHRIDELEEAFQRANATVGADASEREARSQRAEHLIDELEEVLGRANALDAVASERQAWRQRAELRMDELQEALERANAVVGADASERQAWSQRAKQRIGELEEALEEKVLAQTQALHRLDDRARVDSEKLSAALEEEALMQSQALRRLDDRARADSEKLTALRQELEEERSSCRECCERLQRDCVLMLEQERCHVEEVLRAVHADAQDDARMRTEWESTVANQSAMCARTVRKLEDAQAHWEGSVAKQSAECSLMVSRQSATFEELQAQALCRFGAQAHAVFESHRCRMACEDSRGEEQVERLAREVAACKQAQLGEEASRQASELSSVSRKLGMFESELREHEDIVAQRFRDTQAQIRQDLEAGCRPLEEAVTSLRQEFEEQVLQHSKDEFSQVISGKKGCIFEGFFHDGLEAAPLPSSRMRLGDLSQVRVDAEDQKLRTPRPPTWRGCTAPPAPLVPAPPVPSLPLPGPPGAVLPVLAPLVPGPFAVLPERLSARTPRVV